MAVPKKTLYEILGVPQDATSIDIGLAHQKRSAALANAVPPDPSAVALVQQAYEILSNAHRRAAYDASLVTAAERAAAQQQAPDLEIEPEDADGGERSRRMRLLGMVGGMALVMVVLFFVFRPHNGPPPAEPVAAAPKPEPPPPPRPRTGEEVLRDFRTSAGALMSYSMSGSAVPIGIAVETELSLMVTTCHGIPAGSKLVVNVAGDMQPAELAITDEQLDLCRLLVPGFKTPPLKVAAEDARAGDKIFLVAMDAKGEFTAAEGTVKQLLAAPAGKVLELSIPVPANSSGAAVFNTQGQLVGIATVPHKYGAGLQVALPVSWIAEMRSRTTPAK